MSCSNNNKIIGNHDCGFVPSKVNTVLVNPKTKEVFDKDGNYIGKVTGTKNGVAIIERIKRDGL